MTTALLIIDFINEIVHPDGKLSGKGYFHYIESNSVDKKLSGLIQHHRKNKNLLVHVGVGFDPSYLDHPESSPLFGPAKKYGALNSAEWGCEFAEYARPVQGEAIVRKSRVSAFYNTRLNTTLKTNGIKKIVIAGCATDLAVQSAARDAHDRDYEVVIAADACAAASQEDHIASLNVLRKIGKVTGDENDSS